MDDAETAHFETNLEKGTRIRQWAFTVLAFFGGAQLIAGIISFFAYNWRDLGDPLKLALPQIALVLSLSVAFIFPMNAYVRNILTLIAMIMVGVSMAVVGQVYQLGADPWRLFVLWSLFTLPFVLMLRQDPHFAIWTIITSFAWGLWVEQSLSATISLPDAFLPSTLIAGLVFLLLFREMRPTRMPGWLRWLFCTVFLCISVTGIASTMFEEDFASASLLSFPAFMLTILLTLNFYRLHKIDRPARAMGWLALAIFAGLIGLRLLFALEINDITGFLFLITIWSAFVTAGLVFVLRRDGRLLSTQTRTEA